MSEVNKLLRKGSKHRIRQFITRWRGETFLVGEIFCVENVKKTDTQDLSLIRFLSLIRCVLGIQFGQILRFIWVIKTQDITEVKSTLLCYYVIQVTVSHRYLYLFSEQENLNDSLCE